MKSMIDDLVRKGWAQNSHFLDEGEWHGLLDLWSELASHARPARITAAKLWKPEVRGDSILWLDEIQALEARFQTRLRELFLTRIDNLQSRLNEELFLNLRHFECHFAHYPSGAGYQAHYDQPRRPDGQTEPSRLLSLVVYLNPRWQPGDGGELLLWEDDSKQKILQKIEPRGGHAILFRSDQIFHEVAPAHQPRLSLTGWFRRDPPN